MPIEIPFMSAIFGMFTQFLHVHITIYRNLTPNTTKGQKRVKKGKKGSKKGKKIVKFKNAHRNIIYECNFWQYKLKEPVNNKVVNHTLITEAIKK